MLSVLTTQGYFSNYLIQQTNIKHSPRAVSRMQPVPNCKYLFMDDLSRLITRHRVSLTTLTSQTLCCRRLSYIVTRRITTIDEVATVDGRAGRQSPACMEPWRRGGRAACQRCARICVISLRTYVNGAADMVCIRNVSWRNEIRIFREDIFFIGQTYRNLLSIYRYGRVWVTVKFRNRLAIFMFK